MTTNLEDRLKSKKKWKETSTRVKAKITGYKETSSDRIDERVGIP